MTTPTPASETKDHCARIVNACTNLRAYGFHNEADAVGRLVADNAVLKAENDRLTLINQLATDRVEAAEAKLARIKAAADADAEDLKIMRDGTKLTRHGLVQCIAAWKEKAEEAEKERDRFKHLYAAACDKRDSAETRERELREALASRITYHQCTPDGGFRCDVCCAAGKTREAIEHISPCILAARGLHK